MLSNIFGGDADALLKRVKNIHIIACGTGYHADFVARYCFKALAGLRCVVEVASEYRYRAGVVPAKTLFVAIPLSQSGDTADRLAALREARNRGYIGVVAICNVPEFFQVRECDLVLVTRASVEIGLDSTTAFTT